MSFHICEAQKVGKGFPTPGIDWIAGGEATIAALSNAFSVAFSCDTAITAMTTTTTTAVEITRNFALCKIFLKNSDIL
ncbi:hypothetical protein B1F79_02700 [Coxiella-like endosymbiont of Rhipicephalus sanguineus]|uniref:hypothetical protein n=1 Tax=Coxiella-like endosymbiont of Rhipicephalus sanguineus TaxID=1955402 RepID=UPI00203C2236|nr:hypothetical protein [Coxiella-like endosymbiont of Rhipicephalus sanguineus]MBT8506511.1 hypothetical protein [Coxiella-like endosymbiont of Rhipicephalus sanguineus]